MAAVRQWLESRNVYTQNEWLEACINFVKEDNEERELTSLQLNDLVYEQWLMADIQESSLPRLPEGVGNADICKLEGYFNLQINSILNVGESAYSQIQKMKGQDDPQELNWKTNPSEPKIKSSRMLLLELTDGTQTVFGMEYQQIPSLKLTTPPGTKIQVSGPMTCRLGAMLLMASNVKVLGGSVQVLEENSFWNVLHQAIGQDPAEKPAVIKTEATCSDEPDVNQNSRARNVVINNVSNLRPVIKTEANPTNVSTGGLGGNMQTFSEFGGGVKQHASSGNRAKNAVIPRNSSRDFKTETVSNEEFFDDDDDIIAAIVDEDYFGSDEDFDMEQIDKLELGVENRSKSVMSRTTMTCEMEKVETDLKMLCGDGDDDIFEDDFITRDCIPEDADCFEIKSLHQQICDKLDTAGPQRQSKRAKLSNSHFVESLHHSRIKTSSTSHNHVIQNQTELHVTSKRPINLTAEPMIQLNNSSSGLTKTESIPKPNNSTTLKLSSNNQTGIKVTTLSATSFFQASGLQMRHDGFVENISTATVKYTSHPKRILDHYSYESNTFEAQDTNLEYNAASFEYLLEALKGHQECIVRVKAYIATIVSRSNPSSPNWNVIVKLNDGTDTVDADLSDKVLTELLEFPVDKFRREMQEAIKTHDTALCQRLQKRTELFQRNLACTSCLMDLQFSPDMPRPRVLHLTQPTSTDVSAMLRHVNSLLQC